MARWPAGKERGPDNIDVNVRSSAGVHIIITDETGPSGAFCSDSSRTLQESPIICIYTHIFLFFLIFSCGPVLRIGGLARQCKGRCCLACFSPSATAPPGVSRQRGCVRLTDIDDGRSHAARRCAKWLVDAIRRDGPMAGGQGARA